MESKRTKGKGFLLGVSATPIRFRHEKDFKNSVQFSGAVLLYDGDYSKNVMVQPTEQTLLIYKGDRHLYKSFAGSLGEFWRKPVNEIAGTLVKFCESEQKLEVRTDFLGSEPLYYAVIENTFWITDRIDNFSRFFSFSIDLQSVYTFMTIGSTVSSRTVLKDVLQTNELSTLTFDNATNALTIDMSHHWSAEKDADVPALKSSLNSRLMEVLSDTPESSLMLSAGWDSRVLLANPKNIRCTYTHGDLTSREIDIAFRLGRSLQVPMNFLPLEETEFGADANQTMLDLNGHCLFPHWLKASQFLNSQAALPITSGMFVEHFSGHYGLNIIPGRGRKTRTINSLLFPAVYEKIANDEAVNLLTPLLAKGFDSLPWFFADDVDFAQIQKEFKHNVNACLQSYSDTGTNGIHELCERFKMMHVERQFMANQTKSAGALSGYHHPYVDGRFSQAVLQLKYKHRIGYKLSQEFVQLNKPELLSTPLAATLVSAKSPIVLQEASRFARITGELVYKKVLNKIPKGLGWNNFQFLNQTGVFHDYIDALRHPVWDKQKMHSFVDRWITSDRDAYTLVQMLGRIATVDYQIKCI
ncbi:hypothetical protein [Alteromonas ponticola]|uniref:Asparagine synthetase domain-containing protein n=1 Tax=Alteromonas ponticola TaxID=2720613 RepID=A0ABX1QZE6_9ALTE|nr:hypothetical protein [Alteromonas ponticola]NMH59051.1 hypothetical protein [Alteromonas ponticola]